MAFCAHYCDRCLNQHPDPDNKKQCMILCRTLALNITDKDYPEEWQYNDAGMPVCTAWIKWDWGKDDDGNWIEPPRPPIDDPNQLCLPFIFDELNIPKQQTITI
jgi:hypothetical protein